MSDQAHENTNDIDQFELILGFEKFILFSKTSSLCLGSQIVLHWFYL